MSPERNDIVDIVVVGGGPVGLAAAIGASGRGLRTVVLEPRTGPIDKPCGEGLMPAGVRALRDLGAAPRGREFRGIAYVRGERRVTAPFRTGAGLGVRRTELHAALLAAAGAAGVTFRAHKAVSLEQDADGVLVDGVRARYAIAADGLHSPMRRLLGLERPSRRPGRRWGQRAHFAVEPWSDVVEVHWGDAAEVYVTPVADDLVGVAVLSRARAPYLELLAGFPDLRARLPERPVEPAKGAGPLRQRVHGVRAGRVLLAGDAAGYVDALTGEGLSIGFRCAAAAVDAIAADDPAAYVARHAAITRRYTRLTDVLVRTTALRPLRRHVVTAAERLPGVFPAAVHSLAEG